VKLREYFLGKPWGLADKAIRLTTLFDAEKIPALDTAVFHEFIKFRKLCEIFLLGVSNFEGWLNFHHRFEKYIHAIMCRSLNLNRLFLQPEPTKSFNKQLFGSH